MTFNAIGTITSITGNAIAIDDKGIKLPLQLGDPVYSNQIVQTAEYSVVEVRFENGSRVDLGSNSQLTLDNKIFADAGTAAEIHSDTEALQAAIEAGEDPTEQTEAPAAGPDDEKDGSEFVRVEYAEPRSTPESGFDTTGTNFQAPRDIEELLLDPEPSSASSQPSGPFAQRMQDTVNEPVTEASIASVDEAALYDGSDSASDNEQTTGTLNFSTGGDNLSSLQVNGDTVAASGTTEIQGQYGILTIAQTGEWTYTLTDHTWDHDDPTATGADDQVADTFQFTVTDSDGDQASNTLTININDDGPTAVDDSVTLDEGTEVSGNLLENDVQGADSAHITAINGVKVEFGADTVIRTANGTLTVNAEGAYTFVANANFNGTESFDYTLTDCDGDPSHATFAVTVKDAHEPVTEASIASVDESAFFDGSDSASDNEQTTGTLNFSTGGDNLSSLQVNGDTVAASGTTEIQGQYGILTIAQTGEWTYSLTDHTWDHDDPTATGADDQVADTFQFTVTDSDGDQASNTLTININDDGPTAVDDSVTLDEGTEVSGNLLENDVQGADSAHITAINGVKVEFGADTVIRTANGTLTVNAEGAYTFVANANFSGTESFDYTLTDCDGDPSHATLQVTVNQLTETVFDLNETVVHEEGNECDETDYVFTVHRSGDVSEAGSVEYTVSGGNYNPANADDFADPNTLDGTFSLSFEAGETEKQIVLKVNGDTCPEGCESFTVTLSNPSGTADIVRIDNPNATGIIIDDDYGDNEVGYFFDNQDLPSQVVTIAPDDVLNNSNGVLEINFGGEEDSDALSATKVLLVDNDPSDGVEWQNTGTDGSLTYSYGSNVTVNIDPQVTVDIL